MRAPASGEDCVWYESTVINDFSVDESRRDWVCRLAPESFVAVADGPARVFLTPDLARTRIGPESAAVVTLTIHEVTPHTGRPGWDDGTRLATHFSIRETIVRPDMEIFVIGKPSRKPGSESY